MPRIDSSDTHSASSEKATSITEYALSATEQTLVVVNIHAVNFSMGTGAYRQQFEQVREVLRDHDGPIILSGDFNTWRRKREQVVEDVAINMSTRDVSKMPSSLVVSSMV